MLRLGPLALALCLAGGVEPVVVLVLVLFAVAPRLFARIRPPLHQVLQVERHGGRGRRGSLGRGGAVGDDAVGDDAVGNSVAADGGGAFGGGGAAFGGNAGGAVLLSFFLRRLGGGLRGGELAERVVQPESPAHLVRLLVAHEVYAEAHLLQRLVVLGFLFPVGLLPVGHVLVLRVGVLVAAARQALALLGQALLQLGARALPEVRGALLVQHHAADGPAELLVVLVLVGQPVAGLELVAVAHLEGHLRLRLGEALVGEHELVNLLLQGLLLELLETRLERLQTLLDDLLLRLGELVVVVVARARQQGVARDVRGRGVLVRGRREGRLRHRDVSHGRLG